VIWPRSMATTLVGTVIEGGGRTWVARWSSEEGLSEENRTWQNELLIGNNNGHFGSSMALQITATAAGRSAPDIGELLDFSSHRHDELLLAVSQQTFSLYIYIGNIAEGIADYGGPL
jgi:hypothetical protein